MCVCVCAERDRERKKERRGEKRRGEGTGGKREYGDNRLSLSSTMLTLYKINH